MKTKIESYVNEAADFNDKEVPKVGSNFTCLGIISGDSVLKEDESYYLQVLLRECKYTEKEKVLDILQMIQKILLMIPVILMKKNLEWVKFMR